MCMDLELLRIAELVVVRNIVNDIDVLVHEVFELLLALTNPDNIVHRIVRNFRMGIRECAAVPAASAQMAITSDIWLARLIEIFPSRVHLSEQTGSQRIHLL